MSGSGCSFRPRLPLLLAMLQLLEKGKGREGKAAQRAAYWLTYWLSVYCVYCARTPAGETCGRSWNTKDASRDSKTTLWKAIPSYGPPDFTFTVPIKYF